MLRIDRPLYIVTAGLYSRTPSGAKPVVNIPYRDVTKDTNTCSSPDPVDADPSPSSGERDIRQADVEAGEEEHVGDGGQR
jgi:hypothetical protein